MANPVVFFEIPAQDPKKLTDFYNGVFGWTIKAAASGDYWTVETVDAGATGINGGLMKKVGPNQTALNYVQVDSIEDASAKVTSAGGRVVHGKMAVPGQGWFAIAIDPEGNAIGLWQNDPNARPVGTHPVNEKR
jgi:hypothetical protein